MKETTDVKEIADFLALFVTTIFAIIKRGRLHVNLMKTFLGLRHRATLPVSSAKNIMVLKRDEDVTYFRAPVYLSDIITNIERTNENVLNRGSEYPRTYLTLPLPHLSSFILPTFDILG